MTIRFHAVIYAAVFLVVVQAYGDGATNSIDRASLPLRTHVTWEGTYVFSEESVLEIERLKDLHVLVYRCPGEEGELVDFAEVTADGKFRVFREADTSVKGVTPKLEGIDILVGSNEAEIIVRWRHPGQGEERTVEKYRYSDSGMRLINRSHYITKGRGRWWISDETSKCSTPAKYSPLHRVQPPASEVSP